MILHYRSGGVGYRYVRESERRLRESFFLSPGKEPEAEGDDEEVDPDEETGFDEMEIDEGE
jgi:hypothetical protein